MARGRTPNDSSEGRKATRALLFARAGLILVWLCCGLLYLTMPGSPDQYEFDYLGWRILEGDVPYRDFVDMNWPLNMFLHAIGVALFGNQLWSWHAVDYALVALAAGVASRLVGDLAGDRGRTLFLLVYPIIYVALPFWFVGQPDMTGGHLLVLGASLHVNAHRRAKPHLQFAAGLFYGAAVLAKPTLAVAPVLLSLAPLALGTSLRNAAQHCLFAFLGTLATLCLGAAAVLACGTSVQELLDATIVYNTQTQFARALPFRQLSAQLLRAYREAWLVGIALSILALLRLARKAEYRPLLGVFVVLWVSATISFFVQRQGFLYHTASMTLPLVALMTVGALSILSIAKERGARWGVGLLPVFLLVGPAVPRLLGNYGTLALAAAEGDFSVHQEYFYAGDGLSVYQTRNVAKFLRRKVDRSEKVLHVGTNSAILFLAERRNATRFYYMPVLERLRTGPLPNKWLSWLERDLKKGGHDYVIIRSAGAEGWISQIDKYPAARILKTHLSGFQISPEGKWARYPSLRVYQRKDAALKAGPSRR